MTALVLSPPERTTPEACEAALTEALRGEAVSGLVAPSGALRRRAAARLPRRRALRAGRARAWRGAGQAVGGRPAAGVGRAVAAGRAREAYHEARCALEARELGSATGDGNGNGAHAADGRDLPRPRLLPAAALAAGHRRAAPVLRVAAGADRARRGPLRRRAHALARGLHRVQRPVGGGRATPVLPPSYAALSHPQDRGAHRARPELRARPHRVLAGAARPRDRRPVPPSTARSTSEGWRPHRDQDRRVPRRADARRACASSADRGHEVVVQAGAGEGSAITDDDYVAQGAQILPDADAVFAEADLIVKVKEPQPVEVARLRAAPHALHLPAPGARSRADAGACSRPARRRSPTRPSRTRAGGCRCWRR